jgi:hypothetical protein
MIETPDGWRIQFRSSDPDTGRVFPNLLPHLLRWGPPSSRCCQAPYYPKHLPL